MARFEGELLHFGVIRSRITGSGTFIQTLYSLDNAQSETLPNLTLSNTSGIEPSTLASFVSQRAALDGRVSTSGDYFNISKITIYVRPVATGLPQ